MAISSLAIALLIRWVTCADSESQEKCPAVPQQSFPQQRVTAPSLTQQASVGQALCHGPGCSAHNDVGLSMVQQGMQRIKTTDHSNEKTKVAKASVEDNNEKKQTSNTAAQVEERMLQRSTPASTGPKDGVAFEQTTWKKYNRVCGAPRWVENWDDVHKFECKDPDLPFKDCEKVPGAVGHRGHCRCCQSMK